MSEFSLSFACITRLYGRGRGFIKLYLFYMESWKPDPKHKVKDLKKKVKAKAKR